jgi:hypothetical protein
VYRNQTGQPIYVNQDRSKVVAGDSPEAAFLLVGAGAEIPDEEAAKYDLPASHVEQLSPLEERRAAHKTAVERGSMDEAAVHAAYITDLEQQEAHAAQHLTPAEAMPEKPVRSVPRAADKGKGE